MNGAYKNILFILYPNAKVKQRIHVPNFRCKEMQLSYATASIKLCFLRRDISLTFHARVCCVYLLLSLFFFFTTLVSSKNIRTMATLSLRKFLSATIQ